MGAIAKHQLAILKQSMESESFFALSKVLPDLFGDILGIVQADQACLFQLHTEEAPTQTLSLLECIAHSSFQAENTPFLTTLSLADWHTLGWQSSLEAGTSIQVTAKKLTAKLSSCLSDSDLKSIVLVPIYQNKELWGGLGFEIYQQDRPVSENHILFLTLFADIISSKIALLGTESDPDTSLNFLTAASHNLNKALASSDHGLWEWDLTTNKVYFSCAWKSLMGYENTDLINDFLEWQTRIHPTDVDVVMGAVQAHLEGKTDSFDCEYRMKKRSGEWVWFQSVGRVIQFDGGEPVKLAGLQIDISKRKRAEQNLISEKSFLKQLIDKMPALVWVKDKAGVYVTVNKLFEEYLGISSNNIIGKTDYELVDTDLAKEIIADDQLALAQKVEGMHLLEAKLHFDTQSADKSGIYEIIKMGVDLPETNAEGLLGMAHDISHRKRLEKKLRRERDLFSGGPVALVSWALDEHWSITYASDNVEPIFGYSSKALMDKDFRYATIVYPEDLDRVAKEVSEHLKNGDESWEQSYRIVLSSGEVRWIFDYTRVEKDEETGEPSLLYGYIVDDSERKNGELQLGLYARVFLSTHDGIMICDENSNILKVNPAFTEITGYEEREVIGKNPKILSSGKQPPEFYAFFWEAIQSKGEWSGELWNRQKSGDFYIAETKISVLLDAQGEITNYVGVFSDITREVKHQEKLENLAHYDALTQLPNRVLLSDRLGIALARAKRKKTTLAVCFVDLDGFKPINDQYGHDSGDKVLIEIANRIRQDLREEDTVARIGGDEFILLLGNIRSKTLLTEYLNRLLLSLNRPFPWLGSDVSIGASIGIALSGAGEQEGDALVRQADQAMYEAKRLGRNRYHFFDVEEDALIQTQSNNLNEIKYALEDEQFELFYQPKVLLETGKVEGYEALIRWNHPENGVLPPVTFLPQTEGKPISLSIDFWVIKTAFEQHDTWSQAGYTTNISVNIAGEAILSPTLIPFLVDLTIKYPNVSPYIELEILETASLLNIDKAIRMMEMCIELGFSIALDDFGTGHSSLTYLRHLPVQTVKIDQSFVRDMLVDKGDWKLVDSVIGLAESFELHSVAEGVETFEIGRELKEMGCEYIQGYGVSKPMPAPKVLAWKDSWDPKELLEG